MAPREARVLIVIQIFTVISSSGAVEPADKSLAPIVITAPKDAGNYDAANSRIGLARRPLIETPVAVTVLSRAVMDDQLARAITGLIGNDASVGENYAPLGYYESFSIRGFTLDNASGYKRNGLTVANESSMPLENKERVEIVKGIAGLESGLAAPGGVVNYVTKRPTESPERSVELELSGRGTRYAHLDLGDRFGDGKRFGYRFNAAHEAFHPYVKEAVGHRDFLSLALDWRPSENTLAAIDSDWQKKSQLSVPAYQPLGGNALPSGVRPEKMLNNQPWSEPVSISALNVGGNFQYRPAENRQLEARFNHNRLVSNDNAAFPYGCSSGPAYLNVFCGNGDYDLYDYRSTGEVRTATHGQVVLSGERDLGPLKHEALAGLSYFKRTVDLGQEVYDFVGTDNIYNPSPLVFAPSANATGAVHRVQNYVEAALFAQDAISVTRSWKLHAGLRWSAISDDHFSKQTGGLVSRYNRSLLLPQFAVTAMPREGLMAYASYGEGLELGGTAGVTAANAGQIQNPKRGKQVELGVKRDFSGLFSLNAALFRISKPYEFTDANNVFVQRGAVKHAGIELSAVGRATDRLRVIGSASLIRARQDDAKVPVNVPWLRSQAALDYGLPWVSGAAINGTWAYVSRKYARRDNTLSVPAYRRYDLGARYEMRAGPRAVIWRLRVENALDTVYWKDVGEAFGDGYLHLGAPRTFSLSAQVDF